MMYIVCQELISCVFYREILTIEEETTTLGTHFNTTWPFFSVENSPVDLRFVAVLRLGTAEALLSPDLALEVRRNDHSPAVSLSFSAQCTFDHPIWWSLLVSQDDYNSKRNI